MQSGIGPVRLEVPRDRAGSFEPVLVPKRSGRISGGLDDMIISLYAHGMTVRDILHHLKQVYGTELSPETVSRSPTRCWTRCGPGRAGRWTRSRPVVFLDAIMVKVRDNHVVRNKPAYLGVGVDTDGDKHVLGIWLAKTPLDAATAGESARFWGSVMADLRNRGVRDILIACCDGLSGFEDAIRAAFPATAVQTCVVHLMRNACGRSPAKTATPSPRSSARSTPRRMPMPPSRRWPLRRLARSGINTPGGQGLGRRLGHGSPRSSPSPRPVRKLLYTTNSIESLNYQLRKVTKNRGHFPGDDAVVKLLWLAIINIEDKRARERAARARRPASVTTSPHASSKDKEPWAGAKHSTNSTPPTQGESGKRHQPS